MSPSAGRRWLTAGAGVEGVGAGSLAVRACDGAGATICRASSARREFSTPPAAAAMSDDDDAGATGSGRAGAGAARDGLDGYGSATTGPLAAADTSRENFSVRHAPR